MMVDGTRSRRLYLGAPLEANVVKALRLEHGIELAETDGEGWLTLRYRRAETGLDRIIPWLAGQGLVPAIGPLGRLRLALQMYADANGRQLASAPDWWDGSLRRVHVVRQPRRLHGRRDERAQHWRKYLDRET